MKTADILRLEREKRNMTQKDIASYIHVGRAAYSMYEIGKNIPPTEVICKLADLYNVTTDYLLARTQDREIPIKRARRRITRQEATEETLDEAEYRNTGNDGKGRHRAPQRKREHTETENGNERAQEETGTAEERTTNAGADRNGAAAD